MDGTNYGGEHPQGGAAGVVAYQYMVQQQLQMFWSYQRQEIEHVHDFKNHQLPLARIKKIMKADEDVRMISAEAPILFSKACEFFILELTIRSWLHSEENKRRTLQRTDVAGAIIRTDILDFLLDIFSKDELKEEAPPPQPTAPSGVSYYYPPIGQPPPISSPGMMLGGHAVNAASGIYVPSSSQTWQSVWPATTSQDGGYSGDPSVQGGGQGDLDGQL